MLGSIALWVYPIPSRLLRVLAVALIVGAWINSASLLRPKGWLTPAIAGLSLGLLAVLVRVLPGRPPDIEDLRDRSVRALASDEDVHDIWGGDNRLGIDRSGLVRRGMIEVSFRLGLATWNPRLLRAALGLRTR